MKTLRLRTPSIIDGQGNTVGPQGLQLAKRQGGRVQLGHIGQTWDSRVDEEKIGVEIRYRRIFYCPQIPVLQTALAFCSGLGYTPEVMPVVFENLNLHLEIQRITAEMRLHGSQEDSLISLIFIFPVLP